MDFNDILNDLKRLKEEHQDLFSNKLPILKRTDQQKLIL